MEIEEKKMTNMRLKVELKETNESNYMVQKKLDDYIEKYKRQIDIFEDKSLKHIQETNEIHAQYRGHKTKAIDLEQKINQFRLEAKNAIKAEK